MASFMTLDQADNLFPPHIPTLHSKNNNNFLLTAFTRTGRTRMWNILRKESVPRTRCVKILPIAAIQCQLYRLHESFPSRTINEFICYKPGVGDRDELRWEADRVNDFKVSLLERWLVLDCVMLPFSGSRSRGETALTAAMLFVDNIHPYTLWLT